MFFIGTVGPGALTCSGCLGNNSIVGCTFAGTNTPTGGATNYGNSRGGGSGYSELFEIGGGYGLHPDNILLENNTFKDPQGDAFITYSPCGTANPGTCGNGAPGTEGPSHVTLYSNTFTHCAQPGLHVNGGQNIHLANNTFTDCNAYDEEDPGTLQVMTGIYWNNNTFNTTSYGSSGTGSLHSCMGSSYIASDGSGCWSVNNLLQGRTSGGAGSQLFVGNTGCAGGHFKPGNYYGNALSDGAFTNTGC
jgi:hypothetical protein